MIVQVISLVWFSQDVGSTRNTDKSKFADLPYCRQSNFCGKGRKENLSTFSPVCIDFHRRRQKNFGMGRILKRPSIIVEIFIGFVRGFLLLLWHPSKEVWENRPLTGSEIKRGQEKGTKKARETAAALVVSADCSNELAPNRAVGEGGGGEETNIISSEK